jgi:hypothetical protein
MRNCLMFGAQASPKSVLAVCVPILALVVTAGCTKRDDGNGVASVSGTTVPSPTASLSILEEGIRHAQCMRDHGVPEADPTVNSDGSFRLGGGYDKHTLGDAVVQAATDACKPFAVVLPPDVLAQKLAGARLEAQCMRAQGVENYPDPDPNDLGKSLPDAVRDDPQYDDAKEICLTRGAPPPVTAS